MQYTLNHTEACFIAAVTNRAALASPNGLADLMEIHDASGRDLEELLDFLTGLHWANVIHPNDEDIRTGMTEPMRSPGNAPHLGGAS
jgi:hypothetical protein